LQGVRGKHKLPGEFRSSQNWIGGASINDATFIPPIHSDINEYMGDLENFVHNSESFFPDLLKIALIHYQFETSILFRWKWKSWSLNDYFIFSRKKGF
jgi:hypothetical protein